MTKEKETGVWGITRKMDFVHWFPDKKTLCEARNHKKGWLFIVRPNWSPDAPGTCSICLRLLELEKIEEQARRKDQKVKV